MSNRQTIQRRASIVLTAIAIVLFLLLFVNSLDVPVRHDVTHAPSAVSVPPSMQKVLLR